MDALKHVADRLWSFYVDHGVELLQSMGIALALAGVVLVVELGIVGWERSSVKQLLRLSNSTRTDLLAFVFVESSIGLFVGMAMFFGVTYVLQKLLGQGAGLIGKLTLTSQIAAVAVFFLVIDFANYWSHRFCHTVPVLWEIHRYHHSAPEMTVFTAARDHPMERAFSSAIVSIPAAFLATPAIDFAILHMLAKMVGLLKHSNLYSNLGWVGRYLIQSPAAHRVHHSMDPAHHNKNFASLFQCWDVMFGTAVHPSRKTTEQLRIGVDGDDGQTPPLTYVVRVFVAAWRRLLRIQHG